MRFFLFVWLMEETDKDWIRGKRQKIRQEKTGTPLKKASFLYSVIYRELKTLVDL